MPQSTPSHSVSHGPAQKASAVPPASTLWSDYPSIYAESQGYTANEHLEVASISGLDSRELLAVDIGSYGKKRLWGKTTYWDSRCVYVVELDAEVVTTTVSLSDAVNQYNGIRHEPLGSGVPNP